MRAGLFMCDHVAPKYIEEFGDYSDMFKSILPGFEWIIYDCINGVFPNDLDECDVYFATGSKHSVYEDIKWIDDLKDVIAKLYDSKKYFIGFCFGHQLIGDALGGHVAKSPNGWCVGVHDFEISSIETWMQPPASKLGVLMMCQDQILRLPPESKVLAKSELCPNAIIQVGDTFLGIQGHPEFTKEYDKMLMQTRMNRMGDEVAHTGIKSLVKKVDTDIIRQWLYSFVA